MQLCQAKIPLLADPHNPSIGLAKSPEAAGGGRFERNMAVPTAKWRQIDKRKGFANKMKPFPTNAYFLVSENIFWFVLSCEDYFARGCKLSRV